MPYPGLSEGDVQRLVDDRLAGVSSLIRQLQGEKDWHEVGAAGEPAFQNSWVNLGGISETMAFRFLTPRTFALKGGATGGIAGAAMFTLPSAYWPAKDRKIGSAVVDTGLQVFAAILVVTSAGAVYVYAPGTTGVIEQAYIEAVVTL